MKIPKTGATKSNTMPGDLVFQLTKEMIRSFEGDQKRIHHAMKVHGFSRLIAKGEGLSQKDSFRLEIAALFHDIGIPRCEKLYGSTAGPLQEKEGPPVAQEILADFSLNEADLERILFLIGHHHSFKLIDGPDFQILMEADFLVNMFEDNMNQNQIKAVSDTLFRTSAGLSLLDDLRREK